MPKFNESEKEILKNKLHDEGERLFSAFGLKKVSIDELVKAVGIAKGSFYSFYPTKEHLFMEIVVSQQAKMWEEMDMFLQEHKDLPPKELVKQTFIWMLQQFERYPLIQKIDNETTNYLFRKLPKEIIEEHTKDDGDELLKLQKYGVCFKCDIQIAAKVMQTLAMSFFTLQEEDEFTRITTINTMLDGVLNEIVGDKNDSCR